ncbi:MAG: hypothetical protein RR531_02935 [Longicatena sp.]
MKRTRKDEDVLMKYLGRLYQKYEETTSMKNPQVMEQDVSYNALEFRIDMDRILCELPEIYAEIIRNDFLCLNDSDWWKNKYDEKTHEQLKNIAVEAFFHCLYT